MTTDTNRWEIPPKVWAVLLSWGAAVLLLAALFSAWVWSNQQQDRQAMCELVGVFVGDLPEPPAGPQGDRARAVRDAMQRFNQTLECRPPG